MTDPTPIRTIEVVPYDPAWATEFAQYADRIKKQLGSLIIGIEHVGSTSVEGLAAKPIIDMDIVISSRLKLPAVIEGLAAIDYIFEGNLGIPGREAFKWPTARRHHLYVCSVNTPNLHNHLIFRDYLRANPAARDAYGALKQRLAGKHRLDPVAYSTAKTEFVLDIISKAEDAFGFEAFQPDSDKRSL